MKRKYLNKKESKGRKESRGLSADGRDKRRLIKLMSEFITMITLFDVLISKKKAFFVKYGKGHYW